MRNVGSAIGISVTAFLLARNTQTMHAELTEHVTPFNRLFDQPIVHRLWDLGTVAGRAALNQEVTRQASIIAYADDFKLMFLITLTAMPLLLLMRAPKAKPRDASKPAAMD